MVCGRSGEIKQQNKRGALLLRSKTKTNRDKRESLTYDTNCMFSRACYRLHGFPRLVPVTCFPALDTGYTFSRAWQRLYFFSRLAPVPCFAALACFFVVVAVSTPDLFMPFVSIGLIRFVRKSTTHCVSDIGISSSRLKKLYHGFVSFVSSDVESCLSFYL